MSTVRSFTLNQDPSIGTPFRVYPEKMIVVSPAFPSEQSTIRLGDCRGDDRALGVTPWSFLRTMWAVLWTAFRHPFTTTVINPRTGKVMRT